MNVCEDIYIKNTITVTTLRISYSAMLSIVLTLANYDFGPFDSEDNV